MEPQAHPTFTGKNIVLTGAFVTMKRDAASKVLSAAGAKVSGSVSKTTDLLVYGDKAVSKLSKARALGVALMTEAEMVALLCETAAGEGVLDGAAEKLAGAAAAETEKMKDVRAAIEAANQPFLDTCGATPAQLLLAWIRVFSQRPDVVFYEQKIGRPTANNVLLRKVGSVPAELLALGAELGALEFNWVFSEDSEQRSQWSKGYNGGRVQLRGLDQFQWYPIPEWRKEYESYEYDGGFDEHVAEGMTLLSRDVGQDPQAATLVFDNANDCKRYPVGTVYEYLTRGARMGFTWYWPGGGEGGFSEKLFAASLPKSTSSADVEALLQSKGLSSDEASSMVKWLGEDAVILLHVSESAEGRAMLELAEKFPHANESSSRQMDSKLIENLAGSAPPMNVEQWQALLHEHGLFLENGGAGGSWMQLSVSGIPMCMYQGPSSPKGAQAVLRLKNVTGVAGAAANLEYADLSGAYAHKTDFSGAKLTGAVLIDAVMPGVDFSHAVLRNVDLSGCRLAGASFRGADLTGADFECADLTGADFTDAVLDGARFPGAVLTDAMR